ncbi:hypothetical protein F443_05179, partial [Phytophthora nicotianae P1569]
SVGHVSDLTAEDDTEHDNREGSNYDWLFGPSDDREIIEYDDGREDGDTGALIPTTQGELAIR